MTIPRTTAIRTGPSGPPPGPFTGAMPGSPAAPVLVLALVGLGACASAAGQSSGDEGAGGEAAAARASATDPSRVRATRVEVARILPSAAVLELELPGEIEGGRDAMLSAPLGGYVERVLVDDGDRVAKGATLLRVDASLYGVQLEQARIEREDAERQLARARRLGQAMSEADREARETQVARAKASERLQHLRLRRAILRAPFDGVVVKVDTEVGETAPPGEPLLRLVQLDPLSVSVSVSDRDVVALRPGLVGSVVTDARSGLREATLTNIEPAADLDTRAFNVEFDLPNPDGTLFPGMIATVTVRRELGGERVVVPQDFIVTRLDELGVFLADDGVARWRPVSLGRIVRDQVVVEEGLAPGDVVVVVGHRDLADGDALLVSREGLCCTNGRVRHDELPAPAAAPGETAPGGDEDRPDGVRPDDDDNEDDDGDHEVSE